MEPTRRHSSTAAGPSWADWVSGAWLGRVPGLERIGPALTDPLGAMGRLVGATLGATAAAMEPVIPSPPALLSRFIDAVAAAVVGRRITVSAGDAEVSLQLRGLSADPSPIELALGHVRDVRVDAVDVSWPDGSLDGLTAVFRNVHVRPGLAPVLVAAPIELHAVAGEAVVNQLAASHRCVVALGDGKATVRMKGWEQWGAAEIEPRISGTALHLVPKAVSMGVLRFSLPSAVMPTVAIDLPTLPHGLVITGCSLGERRLEVDAIVPMVETPLDLPVVQQLERRARAGADRFELRR